MTGFVLAAGLLSLAAVALLTRSLWWKGKVADGADVPARSVGLAGVIAVFVVVLAAGGYAKLGAPDRLALGPHSSSGDGEGGEQAQAPMSAASRAEAMAKIDAFVSKIQARIKEKPDDAEAWQMLARTYAALGRQQQALDAFQQAEKLNPNDPTLLSDYAVSLALANNRDLEGAPRALVERALKANPRHPKALALAGTAAYGRKDYKQAVAYWETLAQVEPADSPMAQQIRDSIAEAKQQMAAGPAPASSDAPKTAQASADGAQITGTVTLSDKLKSQVSPNDTVFIFARAVEGPRMPLAILRKQVKDLPFEFKLDDSLAMSPAAKLSSVPQVIVGARVSKSGNAMPQSGDLQGLSAPTVVGARGVKIEIADTVGR
jgi:cytochrome c-type biogenesis protein CcmH